MNCPACGGVVGPGFSRCPSCGKEIGATPPGFNTLSTQRTSKAPTGAFPGAGALGARFEVRAILGGGPLGTVYRAFDREIEVDVAVKVLRKNLFPRTEDRERFLAGCSDARRLSHANLVRIFHADAKGTYPFFAMQLVNAIKRVCEHIANRCERSF